MDVRLCYYITGPVSAELGFINRKWIRSSKPSPSARQTLGARMAYVLGPGVHMH